MDLAKSTYIRPPFPKPWNLQILGSKPITWICSLVNPARSTDIRPPLTHFTLSRKGQEVPFLPHTLTSEEKHSSRCKQICTEASSTDFRLEQSLLQMQNMPAHHSLRAVTVSMSAFLACHQCYCAGSSLAWGLNLRAVVYGIF